MSKQKEFIRKLLQQIADGKNVTDIATTVDKYLKDLEKRTKQYKQIVTVVTLVASILYNVLGALGIW
jgi:flagellar motor component MotA